MERAVEIVQTLCQPPPHHAPLSLAPAFEISLTLS
jgi:hypothetical protein